MRQFFVYILASKRNGTLYVGMTNDLARRMREHRSGHNSGFTKRYHVHMLVHYEIAPTAETAITREKQVKKWNRAWKLELIERSNPTWTDLCSELLDD